MTEQQKASQIESVNHQIENLREQANLANAQINKYIEKRNQLNDQVKKAHQEISELKTERDNLNERVKLLKQERDFIRAKSTPIIDEVNAIREKILELRKKVPRQSQRDLQEELDAIEWKIQTTSLDLQEEKGLIENVKQLEIQLSGYKKIEHQNKKIKDLMTQRKTLEAQADALHKELTDLAQKSQELHSNMIEKVKTVKTTKAEADSLHQAYIKTKEQIVPLYVKIAELTGQLRSLSASMKEEAKVRKMATQHAIKEKEQEVKEKLEAEARDKLKRGEKLSWNEFQLIMGESAQDDSETQD
ncbi:MAG: hypothetical protein ABSA75_03930 [Candidatus Bathyarchaeia archaeon]|jgi:uncharacterized coiled-coil DUF342 family protein